MTWSEAPNFIGVADVQSAYWQIPVHPDHVETTAFVTNAGKYCCKRMPFGVGNPPWLFSEMAHKTLGHVAVVLIYMDDLCVLFTTWENHSKSLESMFAALQAAGLTLKPSKVAFGPKLVAYLGHVISAEGIVAVGKDRIKAIQELPTPTCIKYLLSVLGVMSFVRSFVPNLAEVTAPLVNLTHKECATRSRFNKAWGKTQDTAFAHIKRLLVPAPVLIFPDYEHEFIVHVDASEIGIGAFLAQPSKNDDSKSDLDIMTCFGQRSKHGQRHYSASIKECCGVVLTLAHWRPYLSGKHFIIITDYQALTHLYYMLTRWVIALQNFDFTVTHVAGNVVGTVNVVPDALSRLFWCGGEEPLPQKPALASICRNVPSDRPHRAPGPRDFQASSQNLEDVDLVQNDSELFASAVSLFPLLEPEKLLEEQRAEFGRYIE